LFRRRDHKKTKLKENNQTDQQITIDEINRLLEVGQLLFSVLAPEEINELQELLSNRNQIGNTGDS
jgi:hypothetical protein